MAKTQVTATIAYAARTDFRQRYYANDHARDTVVIEPQAMALRDARGAATTLDGEGFVLVPRRSTIADFTDRADVAARHPAEIVELLKQHTGADEAHETGPTPSKSGFPLLKNLHKLVDFVGTYSLAFFRFAGGLR